MLGPIVVDALLEQHGIDTAESHFQGRLLCVGSVLQLAQQNDVVWGSGINGKHLQDIPAGITLDVRAVRGPDTRRELLKRGIDVPEIYGDPALLLADLVPALRDAAQHKRRNTLVVQNLNEYRGKNRIPGALNPRAPLAECLQAIAESERVVGSSLHGIIVAEALGIPATPVVSAVEHPFKYNDYYGGTGRSGVKPAPDIESALNRKFAVPTPLWDPAPLRAAFPYELWRASRP